MTPVLSHDPPSLRGFPRIYRVTENRKITREEGEGLWVLWNEEQDYVAYGGKAPLR